MIKHRPMYKMMRSGNRLIAYVVIMLTAFATYAKAEPVAKVVFIKPKMMIESDKGTTKLAQRGDDVFRLDTIHTQQNARAIIRFSDSTVLTLSSDTTMHIDDFIFSPNKKQASFEFIKGAFRIVTGAITKTASPNFTVNTPIGTIGIRGTDFWSGNLQDDQSIDVVLLESDHTLEISNEFGKVVLTQAGEGTTLKPNMPPLSPRKWPQKKLDKALNLTQTEQP
jgi:hypothetical protein